MKIPILCPMMLDRFGCCNLPSFSSLMKISGLW